MEKRKILPYYISTYSRARCGQLSDLHQGNGRSGHAALVIVDSPTRDTADRDTAATIRTQIREDVVGDVLPPN